MWALGRDAVLELRYMCHMWTWILIIGGYAFSIFFFCLLGGIGAASDAIQSWGRSTAQRALDRSGASPSSFARARLSPRRPRRS
jgi:hypothetical protein